MTSLTFALQAAIRTVAAAMEREADLSEELRKSTVLAALTRTLQVGLLVSRRMPEHNAPFLPSPRPSCTSPPSLSTSGWSEATLT